MIIVAAYPGSFAASESEQASPIQQLHTALTRLIPSETAVHLLPFYPSDGDGGFAPSDWLTIAPSLGNIEDVAAFAKSFLLIVDGVYNHVGVTHRWCRQFFSGGGGAHRLCVLPDDGPTPTVLSPRGWPVIRVHQVDGAYKRVWRTFSEQSVDLNLDDADVRREIGNHLDFMAGLGARGVRLDAPAYYGKPVDGPAQRHSADSRRLFAVVAEMCAQRGLAVFAQLNCDEIGRSYRTASALPILQDYALPALVAWSLLDSDVTELVRHLATTWVQESVTRPLRTHDGVLLKTGAVDECRLNAAALVFRRYGVAIRRINRVDYEINDSFPAICSIGVGTRKMKDAVLLALTLVLILPGHPYLYLPVLYAWHPEMVSARHEQEDPRTVNREPIARSHVLAVERTGFLSLVRKIVHRFAALRSLFGLDHAFESDFVRVLDDGVFAIGRRAEITAVFNFRRSADWCGFVHGADEQVRYVRVTSRSSLIWLSRLGANVAY